ncbi:MAG: DUF3842 family protein [Clostridiales bacterium]|nr:DUF3842 family protein [Clostridiales bacterium]MCD8224167.1 DUF3842 family protein [Clostridiales bacterium]
MDILVIDGQGGGCGKQIISALKKDKTIQATVTAVGTNSAATAAMAKAGADRIATGTNPIVVCSARADVIIGPIGIVIADSMMGEITAKAARAVADSRAIRLLLPMNQCDNIVVGVPDASLKTTIPALLDKLHELDL